MIDINLKRQAGFFGDIRSIKPKPATIRIMMDILGKWELVPGTSQEMTNPFSPPSSILTMSNPESGMEVFFGTQRFDVFRNPIDQKGSNIESAEEFAKLVSEIGAIIAESFNLKINRLSFIGEYLFEDMEEKEMSSIYNKLFKSTLNIKPKTSPAEWTYMNNVKSDFKISGVNDALNSILQLQRTKGKFLFPQDNSEFDRIFLQMDTNTIQENTDTRFNVKNFLECFEYFQSIHTDILKLTTNLFK